MTKSLLAVLVTSLLVLGLSAETKAQSNAVGTAPGVPSTDTQSRITRPGQVDSEGGSRSEREARDDKGAERATGDQLGPPAGVRPDEAQLRTMLAKQGYDDIRNVRPERDGFLAEATKDGRAVQLRIDPHAGKVEELGG